MVKTITMAELMKKKPPSPQDQHRERVGKGNFNRWNSLSDDSRRPSFSGKRQLEVSSSPPPDAPSKAPRLDSNTLFEQMKAHEGKLQEAKGILEEAIKAKADADLDNNNLLDDGTNSCISKMLARASSPTNRYLPTTLARTCTLMVATTTHPPLSEVGQIPSAAKRSYPPRKSP